MASEEEKNQPETLERESVVEPEDEAQELIVSKISVLSQSFEPELSTIIEENRTSVNKSVTHPQNARLAELARPKLLHLEETLQRFEKSKHDEMDSRIHKIKMRLRELRGSEHHSRQIQTEKSTETFSVNSKAIYTNLQSSLRKVAFEMLLKQIFDKIPELIVKMQHTRAQPAAPEMKALLDTLQATLIFYLGQPSNEHEEHVFNYLCHGLGKFIENIIENVQTNQEERERVTRDEKSSNGHFPVAVQFARKAYKERQ